MSASGKPNQDLRDAVDALANQLCVAVDGNFDFSVRGPIEDETIEKLAMLVNFVLDTARRGMSALRDHNNALAEIDRAKTAFFSNISHELRTPLTLMLGPLEDALAGRFGSVSPPLNEQLDLAHRNSLRLLKLVNTLLEFSRIEAGRLRAAYEPLDLAALTSELASMFRAAVERAGLALVVDCQPLAEPTYVDRQMWEKIVLNLLSNAIKFTFEGTITVSLRATRTEVVLQVADTGTGIAADELPRIFERFHRIAGARSRSHEGTGIGLALVKELVKLHGGTIDVRSEQGRGTSFEVRIPGGHAHLPAEQVRSATPPDERPMHGVYVDEAFQWVRDDVPAASESSQPAAGARVLVVDDNADMRRYLANLLSPHWHVEVAEDGGAALAAIAAQLPDLVLTDVMMPGIDGFGLLRELRANPRTREVPIIMLSARAGEEAKVEGREAGADDYIVKPFTARELIARVGSQLALVTTRRELLSRERQVREHVETESRFNASMYRVSTSLIHELDTQQVMQLITDEATSLVDAQFGAFFLNGKRPNGEAYLLHTLSGAQKDRFRNFPPPRVTPLFGTTFRGEGIVRLEDVRRDPRFGAWGGQPPGHVQVVSYLAVPVVSGTGEVFGGLFFGHGAPARFTAEHERVVSAIATQAALALEKARLYGEARESERRARDADRRKDEFLAMLGHELRNPLAPMLTAIEILKSRESGSGREGREVAVLDRQVRHMMRLVDDLLDISRIIRGKIQLQLERVEASHIIAKSIEMSRPLLDQYRHTLAMNIERGLWIDGDATRLAQVIANLLTNAAKYTDPGGAIAIEAVGADDKVVITVRDNGQGISEELLPHIFDLFVQDARKPDRRQGGLGVGLTLVHNIVQHHNGAVHAYSDGPGRGSRFVVELPAAVSRASSAARAAHGAESALSNGGRAGQRVLLVDDNEDAASLLADALRIVGHEVAVAFDAPRALSIVETFSPAVAILDIGLPVMDGYELAQQLRTRFGESVRIIALSGYGLDADKTRSRDAGFDAHLVKPVDLASLFAMLATP